jgi:hypothetical protein
MSQPPHLKTTHITKQELRDFLNNAANGTSIIYAVSKKNSFARDCDDDADLNEIRRMAWDGPCCLVQRRMPPSKDESFEYIAVKSSRDRWPLRPDKCYYFDDAKRLAEQKRRENDRKKAKQARSLEELLGVAE